MLSIQPCVCVCVCVCVIIEQPGGVHVYIISRSFLEARFKPRTTEAFFQPSVQERANVLMCKSVLMCWCARACWCADVQECANVLVCKSALVCK